MLVSGCHVARSLPHMVTRHYLACFLCWAVQWPSWHLGDSLVLAETLRVMSDNETTCSRTTCVGVPLPGLCGSQHALCMSARVCRQCE